MENTREIKNLPVLIKCFAILKISSCSPSFNTRIQREQEFFKMKIIRRGEQQGLDSFFPRPRWLFRKSNDRYWQRDIPDPFSSTQVKRY